MKRREQIEAADALRRECYAELVKKNLAPPDGPRPISDEPKRVRESWLWIARKMGGAK